MLIACRLIFIYPSLGLNFELSMPHLSLHIAAWILRLQLSSPELDFEILMEFSACYYIYPSYHNRKININFPVAGGSEAVDVEYQVGL